MPTNALNQPIGEPVSSWDPVSQPPRTSIKGRFCRIEPIDIDRHGHQLFAALYMEGARKNWTYLPYGPFSAEGDFLDWMETICLGRDPLFHAIPDREWPAFEAAFSTWLDPGNVDDRGRQKTGLGVMIKAARRPEGLDP